MIIIYISFCLLSVGTIILARGVYINRRSIITNQKAIIENQSAILVMQEKWKAHALKEFAKNVNNKHRERNKDYD